MNKIVSIILMVLLSKSLLYSQAGDLMATKKTYGLVVGISKYKNIIPLRYADDDARLFAKCLIDQQICKKENIALLIDSAATTSSFYKELSIIKNKIKQNDKLIIYFAGHGDIETEIESGFLLPYNSEANNYPATAIDISMLEKYVNAFVAKNAKVILITDACRSGNLAGGSLGASSTITAISKSFNNVVKIMSCQPSQLSQEKKYKEGGHGIFTKNLVDGFYGLADKNNDGSVTLRELDLYLDNVSIETNQNQIPKTEGDPLTQIVKYDQDLKNQLAQKKIELSTYAQIQNRSLNIESQNDSNFIKFKQFIYEDKLITPKESNAYELLQRIKKVNQDLYDDLKYELISVLEDYIQELINKDLRGETKTYSGQNKKDELKAIAYLEKIEELLGKNDLRINDIIAKKTYFQAAYHYDTQVEKDILSSINSLVESDKMLPNQAWIKNMIALCYVSVKKFDSAILFLNQVIKQAPRWADGWNNLGLAYSDKGSYDSALLSYTKAIELDPTVAMPYLNIGDLYNQKKQKDSALKYYEKGSLVDSSDFLAYLKISYIYENAQQYEKAKYYANKSLEKDSTIFYSIFTLARSQYNLKDSINSIINLNKAISLNPHDFDNRFEIITFLINNKDLDNSEKIIKEGIELNPKNTVYYNYLGYISYKRGNYNIAIGYFNKTILLNNYWYPNYMIAKVYALIGNTEMSIKYLDKAIEQNKDVLKSFTKDPDFDKIRSKDEFKKFKKIVN
jgi:tetratricopeptide (TPR) repeat protein